MEIRKINIFIGVDKCLVPPKESTDDMALAVCKDNASLFEHDISNCESKIVEAEKVLGALLRSMRRWRRLRKLTA